MGAWNVQVFTNDYALDEMDFLVQMTPEMATRKCLSSEDRWIALIGVALVDVSVNGADEDIFGSFYNYKKWIKSAEKVSMISLVPKALDVLNSIREKDINWDEDAIKERKEVLDKLEKRLQEVSNK